MKNTIPNLKEKMEKQNVFPIEQYVDIALRRKWLIIIPLIISSIITTYIYLRLPKIYRSDTLILVLPQNVPSDYVRATVTAPIEARLASITEELLSRTRLEAIIKEFNLYPEVRQQLPMDIIITMARKNIEIDVKRRDSFKIYFQGKDPETVRGVTNKLASSFIDENLKIREQQARITTDFLNKELEAAKKKLEEQEKVITDFKYKHLGNLPEYKNDNLAMLRQLSSQRQMISDRIIKAEEKKILAQQQFSEVSQLINNEIETPIQAQLDATKKELLLLKSTYTDNHIEVRKLNAKIKQLEDQVISSRKEIQDKISEDTEGSIAQSVNEQLTGINNEIERLIKEESKINQQIAIYEKRLEEIPHVELQLSALSRDYDNTKTFYERLLNKKLEAEQAENLERRQQGEQFKILDPASLPKLPFKPNPKKVFPVGFLLGLCIGCGLVFLVEILDKSFKNEKDAEDYLGVPVLAVIPLVKREKGSHLIVHS